MEKSNYSEDFKRDAVHQIVVRRYPVLKVSRRFLGSARILRSHG